MLFLISCQKDSIKDTFTKSITEGTTRNGLTANCINPFDSIGIEHNEILAHAKWDTCTSVNSLITSLNNYKGQNALTLQFLALGGYDSLKNTFIIDSNLIDSLIISLGAKNYIESQISYLLQRESIDSYETIMAYANNEECDLISDSIGFTLSVSDRNFLLAFWSVFLHSADFWHNSSFIISGNKIEERMPKWLRIALTDAIGGGLGALCGGWVGAGIGAAGFSAIYVLGLGGFTFIRDIND